MTETMPISTGTLPLSLSELSPAIDMEALKGGIMAEIESKLSEKEHHLWKRGQVEIKKLKEDHAQVKDCIGQLQDRQDSLLTENKQIRGALLEVTSRFELVVKEMREVLRALPQQRNGTTALLQPSPSPSAASTEASEALRDELSPESICEPTINGSAEKNDNRTTPSTTARSIQSPGANPKQNAAVELQRDEEMDGATFCTPPRNDASAAVQDASLDIAIAASPAVLSLANSLPPVSTSAYSPTASPATAKRLQLAECLAGGSGQASTSASSYLLSSPPVQRQTESAPSTVAGVASPAPARHFDFVSVEIAKEPGFVTLGIEVNQVDGVSLCIESIDEHGLVGRYNARQDARSGSHVQVGDRVIEVNGIRQDPNLMLQECKVRQRLCFTIARDSCGTQGSRKASSDGEGSGTEEEASPKAPSPMGTRMRPEATVFVPASHAVQPLLLPAVAVVPPGFESFDNTGLLTLPTGPALGTQFASMLEAAAGAGMHGPPPPLPPPMGLPLVASPGYDQLIEEEVKRALFT